ncbi:uncharacterized protein LOC144633639 [Oculina patagonica]
MIGHRAKRDVTSCQPGSSNCVRHICGGNEYWLPYATYWGCCKGRIHDLRETYCTERQGARNCSSPITPLFKCRNGHCIPASWLCNKVNDCQDGSDELGCDLCQGTNNFRCWNGRCVPQSAVCDAYNDCGDGSDETFCRTLAGGWCTTKQYRCPTDVCIPLENVCDGKADCADKSDEFGCNGTCGDGWKHYMSSCYKYFNSQSRWTDARNLCQGIGADLAKITSRDVHDFVFGLGSHQPFDIWIGLRRKVVPSKTRFAWTGGSRIGNFTFWLRGEPIARRGQDMCVEMFRNDNNGRWRTGKCTVKHSSYVCQKGAFGSSCSVGWKHYMSSCYKYFNRQSRWTDARNLCQGIGADLAKITSRDVHDFVFGLGSHQPFDIWIGLRQKVVPSKTRFVWTDGSRNDKFSFWSSGKPLARPGQDMCVEMFRNDNNGRWRTGKCTVKHSSYVCQKGAFGSSCGVGWKHYMFSCYKYFNRQSRWTDARNLCQGIGADLAKITSRDVHDFVFGLGSHQPFDIWIGLRQLGTRFVWTDGSRIGNFTFWLSGKPLARPGQDVCVEMLRNDTDGRWRTGKCTVKHSSYVCQKASVCDAPGNDCSTSNFEKPKVTSFPSEETITAPYGSNVTVECKATGFPRPTVMLIINALTVYTSIGGLVVMAPYEATVTYTVRISSDVECHISNRVGSIFMRMSINLKDDDSAYLKAVLRLKDETYTADLSDPLSERFKSLAGFLEDQLMLNYKNVADVRDVNVVAFRKGSVLADILIHTVKQSSSVVKDILMEAVETDQLGNVELDSCVDTKACPKEFFNVTWNGVFEGEYATQDCPRGAAGVAKRKCLENGVWGYPDYGDCTNREFNQLQEKINGLFTSSRPSSKDLTMIITELSSLTKPKKYDAVMAGNIKTSTQILQDVLNYNKKFSDGREAVSANVDGFLQTVSNLFDINNLRDFTQLQKTDNTTTDLTKIIEDYGLQAAAGQVKEDDKQSWVKDNIAMEANHVPYNIQGPVVFPSYSDDPLSSPVWTKNGKQRITLPKEIFSFKGSPTTNGTKVASFLFRTLTSFLTQESAYEQVGQQFQVESRIISSSVDPPAGKLVEPVVIVFGGLQTDEGSVVCVYWDYNLNSKGGGWSTDGCRLASRKNGTVTCECNHLTNFAVLMDRSGISTEHAGHRKALEFITIIGCSLSLLGLLVTLILHLVLWRILKSSKTVIHVNLCFSLLTANVLLLIGSAFTKYKVLCTVISSSLHYFFLSAIFWMLAEGLQIYSSIVKVFGGERKLKYFYFLGWGFPLLFVSICLAITRTEGYGGDKTCWLSISSGLIWTFIGPALTVVLINGIIFVLVLRAMMTSHKMMAAADKEKIKLGIKCSIVLAPLLGITWVFGVLAFDEATVVFLYLFAIFNSLQGLFIFLFHCIFDQQVRSAIITWKRKRQRTSYASAVQKTQPPKSKRISNSLVTERLPSNGIKMSDLTKQANKQSDRENGEVNESYRCR